MIARSNGGSLNDWANSRSMLDTKATLKGRKVRLLDRIAVVVRSEVLIGIRLTAFLNTAFQAQ